MDIGETPPRGSEYTPRSLRSEGISAAYAEGVVLPAIMRLSNHASTMTVHRCSTTKRGVVKFPNWAKKEC
jgi:hypothetical protein